MAQLSFIKQKNKLLYFYPQKVKEQEEVLTRKQQELALYQQIIDKTFEFMEQRIEEN